MNHFNFPEFWFLNSIRLSERLSEQMNVEWAIKSVYWHCYLLRYHLLRCRKLSCITKFCWGTEAPFYLQRKNLRKQADFSLFTESLRAIWRSGWAWIWKKDNPQVLKVIEKQTLFKISKNYELLQPFWG